ncbi:cytochrome c oxidase subunit II, partial [Streptomyces sp. JV178]
MSPNGSDLPHALGGEGGTPTPRRPTMRKPVQALAAGLSLATATSCTYTDF